MMTPEEREAALVRMRAASAEFYRSAVSIGNHPWIEFTGLMNEYINACELAHRQGIDFSECNTHSGQRLPMESYMVGYVTEKLDCIFTGRIKAEEDPSILSKVESGNPKRRSRRLASHG